MNRTMITATNTLAQLQKQMDIVSHNIANIDATGYKRREANFTDLLFQQYNNQKNMDFETERFTPPGIRQGVGAKVGQSQIVMKQGALKTTERPLDMALTKEGQYFRVLEQSNEESAVRFTRDGAFHLTPISENETMLVTGDGYPVLDENNNSIIIDGQAKNFRVTENGRFIAEGANGAVQEFNLGVVQLNKPQFLEQKGGNLLGLPDGVEGEGIFTELNGALRGQIGIAHGALEQSNVEMSKEMTDLINLQRAYQFQSRSVSMADQMMGLVNGIR